MKLETNMTPDQLWAKSPEKTTTGYPVTLAEHIGAVYTAAKCISTKLLPSSNRNWIRGL